MSYQDLFDVEPYQNARGDTQLPLEAHPSTKDPMPAPLPGSSSWWLWGRWFSSIETKAKVGWLFTVYEAIEGEWVAWFSFEYHHFSGGWSRCRNRVRKALLEGARPALLADPELCNLHNYWLEHGRHALWQDNPHHDHYGLSGA